MAERTAEQLLHEFRSNATADVTMSLLRSTDALPYMALMAAYLGDRQIVDGQTLSAAIDADLPALMRSYTPEETDDNSPDSVLGRRHTAHPLAQEEVDAP